ncbi:unnamed protein product, partial [Hapterophycus canaliculatus]
LLLPSQVEPVEYRIKLTPDMEKFTCRGEQEVDLEILEETSSVSLHSKEIYIMEASFVAAPGDGEVAAAGKPMEASGISFNMKLSTATFSFPEPLSKGKGILKLTSQ